MRCHFYELGIKLTQYGHEVLLGRHYLVDVLIDHRHLVEAGRDQRHAILTKERVHFLPLEGLVGLRPAHYPSSTVRGRVEGFGIAFAADDKTRRSHRARDNAEYALTGRSGTLPMNNDFLLDTVNYVFLFPRKVVMVLQVQQHLSTEVRRHVLVDEGVVGR